MTSRIFTIKIWLVSLIFFLPACNGALGNDINSSQKISASGSQGSSFEESMSQENIENICTKLSERDHKPYHVVSGLVLSAGLAPQVGDCISAECQKNRKPELEQTWFYASLKSLMAENGINEHFLVNTNPELRNKLEKNPLYMKEGNKYMFCAYGPLAGLPHKRPSFRIDHTETIIRIK